MRIQLVLLTAVAFLVPLTLQGQEKIDNPLKKAKVGDYVKYQTFQTLSSPQKKGREFESGTVTYTVSAKSDAEVILKTLSIFKSTIDHLPDHELEGDPIKIDLTKPFDWIEAVRYRTKKSTLKKTGEGKEKIKLGDKTYECTWLTATSEGETKQKNEIKVWFSKIGRASCRERV